jgi:hypothetical protein
MHLTTQELDAARAKYRGQIIPADALSVMDAETEALRASGIERRALELGAVAGARRSRSGLYATRRTRPLRPAAIAIVSRPSLSCLLLGSGEVGQALPVASTGD